VTDFVQFVTAVHSVNACDQPHSLVDAVTNGKLSACSAATSPVPHHAIATHPYCVATSFTGTMFSVQPLNTDGVDWTGVLPDLSALEPLDSRSFSVRLRRLSERARSLTLLRKAFTEQQSYGERFPRDSESTSR
jgi:hypothetical protein